MEGPDQRGHAVGPESIDAGRLRLRRRRYLVLRVADEAALDIGRFLTGGIRFDHTAACWILCPMTGKALPITADEVAFVMTVPSQRWLDREALQSMDALAPCRATDLARRGILLSDPPFAGWERLAGAEERLEQGCWLDVAAVFHAHSRWEGVVGVDMLPKEDDHAQQDHLSELIHARGEPPSPFCQRADRRERIRLRTPELRGPFFDTLFARRTTRAFRTDEPLALSALEDVLFAVFGTQGIKQFAPDVAVIKRTSPSGGALHPIEAYVLVTNVEGIPSGLYHYETASHSLAELERMDASAARELATTFTAGQTYFADAHALIVHVARFERNFWKYAHHRKAYKSILMDSGHLSQTLYLTATHRGLGAFYTAAINDVDISNRLHLVPEQEAAIAINGLGVAATDRDELHFVPEPYSPSSVP